MPSVDEIDQITEVIKFRTELSKLGLTETYPTHAAFTEHVRGGLLRAIRDILQEESRGAELQPMVKSPETVDAAAQSALLALVEAYEKIRRTMPASGDRTRRMTAVFSQMKSHAPGTHALLAQFARSNSAGERLAAIAILQMFPDANYLDWLAERLNNPEAEKPFVGYMAAVALLEAVRGLSEAAEIQLEVAISRAKVLAEKMAGDSGRINVLDVAQQEFQRRFGKTPKETSQ